MSQVKKKRKNLWNAHLQRDAMENYQPGDALHTGPPRTKHTPRMVGNVVRIPQYPQHHLVVNQIIIRYVALPSLNYDDDPLDDTSGIVKTKNNLRYTLTQGGSLMNLQGGSMRNKTTGP